MDRFAAWTERSRTQRWACAVLIPCVVVLLVGDALDRAWWQLGFDVLVLTIVVDKLRKTWRADEPVATA